MTREIITRAEAIKLGLDRYFTGKPCCRGHVAERVTRYKQCTGCWLDESPSIHIPIPCGVCGKMFEPANSHAKFCGAKCKRIADTKREHARVAGLVGDDRERMRAYWREREKFRDQTAAKDRHRKRYEKLLTAYYALEVIRKGVTA